MCLEKVLSRRISVFSWPVRNRREWAEWECHAVRLPSEAMSSVTVGDGVGIAVLFPQDGLGTAGWLGAGMVSFALAGHHSCALQLREPTGCTLLTASHFVNSFMWGLKLALKFTSLLMAMVLQKP